MRNPVILQGPGFMLRPFRKPDAASLAENANNRNVWRNLRDAFPYPYSVRDARRYIRSGDKGAPQNIRLAIDVGGKAAGVIGVHRKADIHRHVAEIGYWLGEPYWGRGFMTEAVRLVTAYAFETWRGLERIEAVVFAWNTASGHVLEKAGYTLEGRLRRHVLKDSQYTDSFLYSILRNDATS